MFTLITILALIASILLILVVLIQNPKGGGISASFSSANQIVGVKKTNDFIERATWTLAIVLLLTAFTSSYFSKTSSEKQSLLQDRVNNIPMSPEAGQDLEIKDIPAPAKEEMEPVED
jgi:preprotein translocase subunit SecG